MFQSGHMSPSRCQKPWGNFSNLHYENVVQPLEVKLTKVRRSPLPRAWVPPGIFILEIFPCKTSSKSSITVHDFLPGYWLPQRFPLVGFCPSKLWVSVSAWLSPSFGSHGWPCDLTSCTDPRRVVDFSVCFVFYLLLGQSGDCWAP